jgi:general secretion pathway protein L
MRRNIGSHLWVGLDIGTYAVKLYASSARGMGAQHTHMAEVRLPGDPGGSGPPSDEAVTAAIGECLARAGVSLGSVRGLTTGLSGPDVIIKQVQLPLIDDDEVGQALRFEARKHLPFDPQGMVIDYQVIGRYASEKRLDVLLAAVSENRLQRHLAPLRALDLEPDIVDAAPLAIANAALASPDADGGGRVVLDLGHDSSTLSIWQRGEPFFARRLGFGGRVISKAIGEASGIPIEEAEEWKVAAGGRLATHVLDWRSPEMQAVIEALRGDLVAELRRSFVFYQTQGRLPEPLVVHLCGGTAQLPLLAERIADLLDADVVVFQPPADPASPAPQRGGPQFAQAYGLSLRMR